MLASVFSSWLDFKPSFFFTSLTQVSKKRHQTKVAISHRSACIFKISKVCLLFGHAYTQNTPPLSHAPKPTTPGTDGMALWEGYSWLAREERQRRKQEADRCAALFSASLCRSVIKTFKLKATGLPVLFLFFFFLLACYWQRDICNTGYCWGQLNEKCNLLFYCVIYLPLSAGQCFFSVFSLFLPLAVYNKCSDGCSLLHNGYNWPFLLSPWQYEDG